MGLTLPLALFLLDNVRADASRTTFIAQCPAHTDRNPSLSLSTGTRQELILYCHAGCSYNDVIIMLLSRLPTRAAADYIYQDSAGIPIGKISRTYDSQGNKHFYQSTVDKNGDWCRGGSTELKITPYHLPDVLSAISAGKRIFIVEGEKDADRLQDEGHTTTCNAGGAQGWTDQHSAWLIGAKRIFIVADDDEPGIRHAWHIHDSLRTTGLQCRITVHTSPYAKDISDHLILRHSLREIQEIERQAPVVMHDRIVSGASFIFDSPADVPALWGDSGKVVLWAQGQGLTIMAPQGVGKTTLGILLVEARLGLTTHVVDLPVQPVTANLLYLAMDRPIQIAAAMRRRFQAYGRDAAELGKLLVWRGPPEHDLGRHPDYLVELATAHNAGTVIVDSLKDAVLRLSQEEAGQGWNAAVQLCLMADVQVCVLTHPTKHLGGDLLKPISLDDVYGSSWVTAGMGSVLSLWGERNSAYAELSQLKAPAEMLDPITVRRDAKTGMIESIGTNLDWAWFFTTPHTTSELSTEMFGLERSKANYAKAKRQVDDMTARGILVEHSKTMVGWGEGKAAIRYTLREPE